MKSFKPLSAVLAGLVFSGSALASAAAAAPEGDWHHDGAGDQREGE